MGVGAVSIGVVVEDFFGRKTFGFWVGNTQVRHEATNQATTQIIIITPEEKTYYCLGARPTVSSVLFSHSHESHPHYCIRRSGRACLALCGFDCGSAVAVGVAPHSLGEGIVKLAIRQIHWSWFNLFRYCTLHRRHLTPLRWWMQSVTNRKIADS